MKCGKSTTAGTAFAGVVVVEFLRRLLHDGGIGDVGKPTYGARGPPPARRFRASAAERFRADSFERGGMLRECSRGKERAKGPGNKNKKRVCQELPTNKSITSEALTISLIKQHAIEI